MSEPESEPLRTHRPPCVNATALHDVVACAGLPIASVRHAPTSKAAHLAAPSAPRGPVASAQAIVPPSAVISIPSVARRRAGISKSRTHAPERTSHTRAVPSSDDVQQSCPPHAAATPTPLTSARWPSSASVHAPRSTSHSIA
eukprot:6440305-Prymnesium_polylepis.1